jgi:glutaredoxin
MHVDEQFILYTRDWCGYCVMVKQAAAQLGIDLEERNIWENPQWEAELLAARARATVPVLRRVIPERPDEWMGESREIIRFLADHASNPNDASVST